MSDRAARRVLVTGSTDGIGAQVARELEAAGWHVVRHARSTARADALREQGVDGPVVVGDLASLASTSAMAGRATALGPFDVVVHNAGWAPPHGLRERPVTVDGLEQTFQVNAVAPYLLTCLLPLPHRLVHVSSDSIRGARLDLDDLQHEDSWDPSRAYADSKLALTVVALLVARRLPDVLSTAVHPGWVRTKMSGDDAPLDLRAGADTPVWLAGSDDPAATVSGALFHDRTQVTYNDQAHDVDVQDALERELVRLTGQRLTTPSRNAHHDRGARR